MKHTPGGAENAAYILPDGNVQIAFSGGRSSAYMLRQILDANGGLPDRCIVTFQNTGREMPQTLDFVAEIADRWAVSVVWLEYRRASPFFEIVGHNSASRSGGPFDALIDAKQYLPNQQMRFCTTELKVRPAKRYLLSLGWAHWTNAIGYRADEAHRDKPITKERWATWAPMISAGVSKRDVQEFWTRQPFDLRLPNVRGKTQLGNCDGCFLKSEAFLSGLARDYPDRHAWWEAAEARIGQLERSKGRPKDNAQFSRRFSRAELRAFMDRQGDLALSVDGLLCQADDGECF